jgi:hypothetical protein
VIWAIIPAPIKRAVAWLLAGLVAFAGIWGLAKRDARRGAALDVAKDTIEALETRNEIDDDVAASPDPRQRLRDWQR